MAEDTKKLEMIRSLLESAEGNVRSAKQLLHEMTGGKSESLRQKASTMNRSGDGKVVEGIFDGQNMIDGDGKSYPIPANYASKSKLVEGDGMKLTIVDDGSFIYKQILPVPRKKIIGDLTMDGDQYRVLADGKSYKVLYASVTYYKGNVGDQVTLIVPQAADATWGAVENIIPGTGESASPVSTEAAPEATPIASESAVEVEATPITPIEPVEEAKAPEAVPAPAEESDELAPSADVQVLSDSVASALKDAKDAVSEDPTLAAPAAEEAKPKKKAAKKVDETPTPEPEQPTGTEKDPKVTELDI